MFKLKIERTHSQLYLKIIHEVRNSDPETGDLVLAGLITLSRPKLLERDERIFAIYGKREKIILSACYQILSQEVNKRLSGNCIGGRKGFSRHSFMDFLNIAKEQNLSWIVITDVKSFFASISHEILGKTLKERFRIPKDVLKLVMDLLSLGVPADDPKGIFPGNPLGKLVGNVYLSGLDDFLLKKDLVFVRYIDDIAVFMKTKEEAEKILSNIREYLRENLRMEVAENKTGIYHRYFNRFEFLGFSVVGENIGPSEENIKRFEERVRNLPDEYKRRGLKKFLRRMNCIVYNFGHMYKKGNVRKLYSKLDEVVRASIRRYLKLSGKGEFVNTIYSHPLKFPCNLAFSKEVLSRMGFVSLVQIKKKFDGKDRKCEMKTAGETSAKNLIEEGNRVNTEKIQISVGDNFIITISGKVGIGTTSPTRKLWVNGDAGGTTAWYNDSDERLKKNIVQIDNGLDKVMHLRGVYFEWKDTTNHPKGRQVGLIAKEVEKVLPEVVAKKGEYYSLATSNLVPFLIEAIKEQQKQIEELKLVIEELKKLSSEQVRK